MATMAASMSSGLKKPLSAIEPENPEQRPIEIVSLRDRAVGVLRLVILHDGDEEAKQRIEALPGGKIRIARLLDVESHGRTTSGPALFTVSLRTATAHPGG